MRWLLLLSACADEPAANPIDSTDSGYCGRRSDCDTNAQWEPAEDISVDWDPAERGTVTLTVGNSGATGFYFGMAETAAGDAGWYGEDCLVADCHAFEIISAQLDYVDSPDDVILGQTTLFDGGTDGQGDAFTELGGDRLTYLLELSGGLYDGGCYVWGHDVGYYEGEGCDRL